MTSDPNQAEAWIERGAYSVVLPVAGNAWQATDRAPDDAHRAAYIMGDTLAGKGSV